MGFKKYMTDFSEFQCQILHNNLQNTKFGVFLNWDVFSITDIHYRYGFHIPFSLTIVYTPAFGDTEVIELDNEIRTKMKKLITT